MTDYQSFEVTCFNNEHFESSLTIDRVYMVIFSTDTHYYVMDNSQRLMNYSKERFRRVSQ